MAYGTEDDDMLSAYNPALQRASVAELEAERKKQTPSAFAKAAPAAGTILGAIVGGYFGGPAGAAQGAQIGGGIGQGAASVANQLQGKELGQQGSSIQGAGNMVSGLDKFKSMYDKKQYMDRINQQYPPLAEPQ